MKILTYLQAREGIVRDLPEDTIRAVLTVSGRATEWLDKVVEMVAEKPELSEVEIIEQTGMGRQLLSEVPKEEWVFLVNPSLAPPESKVVREHIIENGKLFSGAVTSWLLAQEIGQIYELSKRAFTTEEAKMVRLLWNKQETVVEREEVAQALWGESWSENYSDWGIDALSHRVRQKISGRYQIVTIKGRGYMLVGSEKPSLAPRAALSRNERVQEIPYSIYPTDEYLKYMNNQKNVRKTYSDLFGAISHEKLSLSVKGSPKILCVNSYSYDNVDAVLAWVKQLGFQGVKVYFVHYDPRAIDLHQARIRELGVESYVEAWHDDFRETKLKSESMDIVINDFRLNFNQNDKQNKNSMKNCYQVLRPGGVALFSTVVDGRYENIRYGEDQEKAPINANKPGMFQADEHLVRRCYSVPYYKQLFAKSGFAKIVEFDIEEGKRWGGGSVTLTVNPWQGPYYRRWLLSK